ncbi:MAG: Ktr system potassium uptake protein A [Deltaproteobacteria bacterium ADurb.BinA179]|jgi:trk system potassium uptake protein TrkA|nr:TrkA family potassium uptake protein [Deltaproteobacteria bacterium]MDI9542432.1 TrkA family potassium uptake protein [Pseudomonadota bacterium]OPZ26089.1 MAG: Ktr system potassium uptake protein A [Deltaproteobacteria bacterium ADurb.BinA179]HRR70399.1 TrkA family potassium uptake protein [Desulfomonilia bacterium]HNU74535.1 TrkA family potassium uptake protein [Deltaproteobacteria bacterium]
MAIRYAVIGLGNFGSWVVRTLNELRQDTIAIDIDKDRVQKIRDYTSTPVLADATRKENLISLGINEMKAAVVSLGDNTSAATLITLYLQEMGVSQIIVKAVDEDHGKILKKVGATDIIFPEKDMGVKVAKSLVMPNILEFIDMSEDFQIAEIAPPNDFVGKSLAQLALPQRYNVQVIGIRELIPERFTIVPTGDFIVKDSDILVVIGRGSNINRIKSY